MRKASPLPEGVRGDRSPLGSAEALKKVKSPSQKTGGDGKPKDQLQVGGHMRATPRAVGRCPIRHAIRGQQSKPFPNSSQTSPRGPVPA